MSFPSTDTVIILITGANTGVGLATAEILARQHPNCHVVIGSRNETAGKEAASQLVAEGLPISVVQLDLCSDDSIEAAVQYVKTAYGRLDVLINNAAILLDLSREGRSTRQLYDETFATNVIGTACLTEACMPLLQESILPRIIFLSSRMASMAEATNKSMPFFNFDIKAYDASKAAVDMLALNYARILEEKGGLVNAVCPGLVNTKLSGNHPDGSTTELGAQRVVEIVLAGKSGPTATFSDRDGPIPW